MTTQTAIRVIVSARNIKQANAEVDPVSLAVAEALSLDENYIRTQRNSITVFDEFDQIESVFIYDDNSDVSDFLDTWEMRRMGYDVSLGSFGFTINKK